jgi:hypothetical protein
LMILLPQSSGDYRLVMLYPALVAFLDNNTEGRPDWLIISLFGLLMVPKAYVILGSDVNIGLLLNPLLLGALLLATLVAVCSGSRRAPMLLRPPGPADPGGGQPA